LSQPSLPPVSVPTLTEVVEWTPAVQPVVHDDVPSLHDEMPVSSDTVWPAESPSLLPVPSAATMPIDEAQLTQRILEHIEQQLDTMFSERLSPLMVAVLDRAVDELAVHARDELASTLQGIVRQAVSQELAQRRDPAAPASPD
jgi:hypothetical protein